MNVLISDAHEFLCFDINSAYPTNVVISTDGCAGRKSLTSFDNDGIFVVVNGPWNDASSG